MYVYVCMYARVSLLIISLPIDSKNEEKPFPACSIHDFDVIFATRGRLGLSRRESLKCGRLRSGFGRVDGHGKS